MLEGWEQRRRVELGHSKVNVLRYCLTQRVSGITKCLDSSRVPVKPTPIVRRYDASQNLKVIEPHSSELGVYGKMTYVYAVARLKTLQKS